ncbi:MAG: HAMP domain-containing protein, partial [Epsilonproteobacteria bacterium]|nr:HAMP domain-containing protein [Campylobacterota bacterium]
MKISTRILISLILSLSFLGGSIIAMTYLNTQKNARFFLEHYQKSAYAFHENELKTIMDLMRQTAMSIYNSQKAKGISDEKIKEAILEKLNDPRFFNDKSGYFFVYQQDGTNVLLPTNKTLEGKNLIGLKDSKGVPFVQELIHAAQRGGGLVKYEFPKSKDGQPLLKFAYAMPFEPYNWTMGTGIYVDNVDKEITLLQKEIDDTLSSQIKTFLAIATVLVLLSVFSTVFIIKKTISNPLVRLMQRADNLSSGEGDLTRKLDIIGNDEIAQASRSINAFIEKVRLLISEAKGLSNENSSISHELSSTSLQVGRAVETSMQIVGDTTTKAHDLKNELGTGIQEAKEGKEELTKANAFLKDANQAILTLTQEIQNSAQTEIELAQKIQQLSHDAEQVKEVLVV